jgi:Txe/YoeB family toxin of Txe-Axe toxin-antitoxin module
VKGEDAVRCSADLTLDRLVYRADDKEVKIIKARYHY